MVALISNIFFLSSSICFFLLCFTVLYPKPPTERKPGENMMALHHHLHFSPSLASGSSPSSLPMAITGAKPLSRFVRNYLDLQPKHFNAVRICTHFRVQEQGSLLVRASSDTDGVPSEDAASETVPVEEAVSVEKLPLESKVQMMLEQKLRMKLAKKLRLRRKRLVQKRRLRKKGRWPPSKMKKNKNV